MLAIGVRRRHGRHRHAARDGGEVRVGVCASGHVSMRHVFRGVHGSAMREVVNPGLSCGQVWRVSIALCAQAVRQVVPAGKNTIPR